MLEVSHYVALGDSMTIDCYPWLDVNRKKGFYERQQLGAASLFYSNDDDLFPEFAGKDLISLFPELAMFNYAMDGATTIDLLENKALDRLDQFRDKKCLVTLTVGGNDCLQTIWDMRFGKRSVTKDLFIRIADRYTDLVNKLRSRLPKSIFVLNTIYDPTDGTGLMDKITENGERLPVEQLDFLNDYIRSACCKQNRLFVADVHKHFIGHGARECAAADRWYWETNPIEPSCQGASEIRRLWLLLLEELNRAA